MAFATGTPLGPVVFNPTPPHFVGVLQHAAGHPPMIPSGDLGGHLPASFTVPGTNIPVGDMGGHLPTRGGIAFFGPGGAGIIPMPGSQPAVQPPPVVANAYPANFQPGSQPAVQPPPVVANAYPANFQPGHSVAANGSVTGQNPDQVHAHNAIQHLLGALGAARDPELRASLAQALAALQKHVAGIAKEHQQMLAGKVSPRLMQQAYSNGPAHSGGAQ